MHNDHIACARSRGDRAWASLTAFTLAQDDIVIPSLPVNAVRAAGRWPKVFVSELRRLPAEAGNRLLIDGSTAAALRARRGSGAPLADLFDEPPWRPTAAEAAAVRGAGGGRAARRTEYAS